MPMSDELAYEFKWWFGETDNKVWVFPNAKTGNPYVDPRKWFANWCDLAGVENKGFHGFRRYVASILEDKYKVSTKAIQRLLRHKKITTTERYLHMIHSDLRGYAGMARPEVENESERSKKAD